MLELLGSLNALEIKVLIFGVNQHGKKETSWENVDSSVKNLGLKCGQGNLGLGGRKLQKNQWKMRKEKVPAVPMQFCCT